MSESTCTPRLDGHMNGENDPMLSLYSLPPQIDGPLCVRGHRKVMVQRGRFPRWACYPCERVAKASWQRQHQARLNLVRRVERAQV